VRSKIQFLVDFSDKEIGWFGTATEVTNDYGHTVYTLDTDLFIYPQLVTGATVATDDEDDKYDNWYIQKVKQAVDSGKQLIWHGHSHVNMGVTPSGTDHGFRKDLNQDGGLHIYTIHNKSGAVGLEAFNGEFRIGAMVVDDINEDGIYYDLITQLGNVKEHKPKPVATRSTYTPGKYGGHGYQYGNQYTPPAYHSSAHRNGYVNAPARQPLSAFQEAVDEALDDLGYQGMDVQSMTPAEQMAFEHYLAAENQ